ncbi:hypothetical protein [Pseudonocardia parietis]|uniref:Uncharacterized protein n=1 Tax=Pseudonocardia parietis TaxID=570936 RepID=A0ABS4VW01_9PSEU|nr:hypothetical protein [Pseudonocardia parietis]MBP2368091.1 hypothetical protein [Pseudonocardia parietis]
MTLLCERCYGPVDPTTDRYYRLAHIDHSDAAGNVAWRHAVVHVDACPAAGSVTPAEQRGRAA